MPMDEMYNGNINVSQPAETKSTDSAPMTKAAHVASAKEPNKSEPITAPPLKAQLNDSFHASLLLSFAALI